MAEAAHSTYKPSTTDAFIGKGTTIEGNIFSEATIHIEGRVNGDIHCAGDVFIGESGQTRSILAARHIINAGKIEGNIYTKGKLTITSKGRVIGKIVVQSLHVSEGGLFHGECRMLATDKKSQEGEQDKLIFKAGSTREEVERQPFGKDKKIVAS